MPACPEELSKQSALSPCVVGDEENVVYVLFKPDHWDGERLMPAAFSKSKLRQRDLSICRPQHTSLEVVSGMVVMPYLAKSPERTVVGGVSALCGDLRDLRHEDVPDRRSVCVVDDGLEGFEGHALLGFACSAAEKGFWTRNREVAVRSDIVRQFSKSGVPLELDECFVSEAAAG